MKAIRIFNYYMMTKFFWGYSFFLFFTIIAINAAIENSLYTEFQCFIDPITSYRLESLKGGLSNNMQYKCTVNEEKYVARLLKESYIERYKEVYIHEHFAVLGIAPDLHHYSDDYSCMIMNFIESNTLQLEDAQKTDVIRCVADTIRFIHQ